MSRIVVGVDSTDDAIVVLAQAFAEAVLREADVDVVTAYDTLGPADDPDLWHQRSLETADRARKAMVRHLAVARTRSASYHDVRTRISVVEGSPDRALIEASADADLLVVGGHDGSGLRLGEFGSVARDCLDCTETPVLVTAPAELPSDPSRAQRSGGVVAAVDISSAAVSSVTAHAVQVITAAAQEVRLRGERQLTILHVVGAEVGALAGLEPMAAVMSQAGHLATDRAVLKQALRAVPLDDLEVDVQVVAGADWIVLENLTRHSSLVVIGRRHVPAWRRLFGTTSGHLATHTHGTLLVVPTRAAPAPERESTHATFA